MRFGCDWIPISHTHNTIGSPTALGVPVTALGTNILCVGVSFLRTSWGQDVAAKVPLEGMVGPSRVTWMAQLAIHADGPKHDGPKI